MEILNLIDPMDESLGSEPQQWDSQTDLRRIQDHVIRVQKDIQAGAQLLLIALPYVEDSIEKISYLSQEEYLDFIILATETLPFSEKDVIFSNSSEILVSKEEQIKEIEQTEDNAITKLVISIPYTSGSIESTFYIIVGNYLILVLRGSVASSFDESKVKFTCSAEKTSLEEQMEEETATPEQLSLTEPECPASDSLPSMAAPMEPEQ